MGDVKEVLKKYWPYILGGVVGIFLILRFRGGGTSGASGGSSDYAAFMQAQSNAAQQNAQLQAQQNSQNAALKLQQDAQNNQLSLQQSQIALQQQALTGELAFKQAQLNDARLSANETLKLNQSALNAQVVKDNNTLELQRMAVQADAFNNFTTAQAAMANSVGSSTAAVIEALNKPAMVAMQANAIENAASLQAAANVAAAGFLGQSNMVAANSNIAGQLTSAIQPLQLPNMGQQQGKIGQALEYGGRAVAAYYTAGGSEVYRSAQGNSLNNNQAYV